MTNVEKLEQEGVLSPANLSKDQTDVINGMSGSEIDVLVGLAKKMPTQSKDPGANPWML